MSSIFIYLDLFRLVCQIITYSELPEGSVSSASPSIRNTDLPYVRKNIDLTRELVVN
jgi:hypothetical protein